MDTISNNSTTRNAAQTRELQNCELQNRQCKGAAMNRGISAMKRGISLLLVVGAFFAVGGGRESAANDSADVIIREGIVHSANGGNFADFYKQTQLRLFGLVEDNLSQKAEDALLNDFTAVNIKKANVDFQTELGGRKGNLAIGIIGSFADTSRQAFGWQVRVYGGEDNTKGGNIGIFTRRISGGFLYGVNLFGDYENNDYGDFFRYGAGAELQNRHLAIAANYYLPASEGGNISGTIRAFSREGFDTNVRVNIPGSKFLKLRADYYHYEENYGVEADEGFRYGMELYPIAGMRFGVFYDDNGKELGGDIFYAYTIGEPQQSGSGSAGEFVPDLFAPILREYAQRIITTSVSSVDRIVNLAAAYATDGINIPLGREFATAVVGTINLSPAYSSITIAQRIPAFRILTIPSYRLLAFSSTIAVDLIATLFAINISTTPRQTLSVILTARAQTPPFVIGGIANRNRFFAVATPSPFATANIRGGTPPYDYVLTQPGSNFSPTANIGTTAISIAFNSQMPITRTATLIITDNAGMAANRPTMAATIYLTAAATVAPLGAGFIANLTNFDSRGGHFYGAGIGVNAIVGTMRAMGGFPPHIYALLIDSAGDFAIPGGGDPVIGNSEGLHVGFNNNPPNIATLTATLLVYDSAAPASSVSILITVGATAAPFQFALVSLLSYQFLTSSLNTGGQLDPRPRFARPQIIGGVPPYTDSISPVNASGNPAQAGFIRHQVGGGVIDYSFASSVAGNFTASITVFDNATPTAATLFQYITIQTTITPFNVNLIPVGSFNVITVGDSAANKNLVASVLAVGGVPPYMISPRSDPDDGFVISEAGNITIINFGAENPGAFIASITVSDSATPPNMSSFIITARATRPSRRALPEATVYVGNYSNAHGGGDYVLTIFGPSRLEVDLPPVGTPRPWVVSVTVQGYGGSQSPNGGRIIVGSRNNAVGQIRRFPIRGSDRMYAYTLTVIQGAENCIRDTRETPALECP